MLSFLNDVFFTLCLQKKVRIRVCVKQLTMNRVWLLVVVVLCHEIFSHGVVTNVSTRPGFVNVGAILSNKSIIGKVVKVAVEAAIEDVNSDPTVLVGTNIRLTMQDSNYNRFLGIVESKLFIITLVFFFTCHRLGLDLAFVFYICVFNSFVFFFLS